MSAGKLGALEWRGKLYPGKQAEREHTTHLMEALFYFCSSKGEFVNIRGGLATFKDNSISLETEALIGRYSFITVARKNSELTCPSEQGSPASPHLDQG